MNVNEKEFIWAEKYRPQDVDDLIFPKEEKEKFKKWLESGEIPNIGLWGSIPGTGKSSIMNIISKQLDVETLWINGSKDNGIDVMRNEIGAFARSSSSFGKHKLICIDESDYLTINAQSTLRSDLEQYSKNVRFIFTGNYSDRIIEPLMNRLQNFFLDDIYTKHKKELAVQMVQKLSAILKNEGVQYEKTDLVEVVKNYYPSVRNMLMFLQKHSINGKLSFSNVEKRDQVFENLITAMKERNFKKVREAVEEVLVPDTFYSYLYKNMDKVFEKQSQPFVILEMADYQDYSQRAKNKHIPLLAFTVKIIGEKDVKFL